VFDKEAAMSASDSVPRVGVRLIGARGSVATTVVAGCAAMTGGLHPPTGLRTETPPFTGTDLPTPSSRVFGGHDTEGPSALGEQYAALVGFAERLRTEHPGDVPGHSREQDHVSGRTGGSGHRG
jgi:hypothetical protein